MKGEPKIRNAKLREHFVENRILEAAMTVFTQQSPTETTVEDLIQASEISRRTFYKYFKSKEDVLAALYKLVTGKMVELMEAGAVGTGQVQIAIDAYLDFHMTNGRLLKHLVEQAIRSDSQLHPRRLWFREKLVQTVSQAVQNETGRKLDPLTVIAVLTSLEGLSLYLLEKPAGPSDKLLEDAKQLMRRLAQLALDSGVTS